MKRFCLLICVLGLASFAVQGQKESKDAKTPARAEQQLLELNERWCEAITKGDASALDRLFADDLIVTTSSGAIRDKSGEIKDAAGSPDPDFRWTSPFTTEDVRIKVYQDAAVVTGLANGASNIKSRWGG